MIRHTPFRAFVFWIALLLGRLAFADAFDPPAGYYDTATGTGATLKQQLNTIIETGHTSISYDDLRSVLQITDADPDNPGHMLLVYDRISLNVAAINPGGSIPGWDSGSTWNREHTWPVSRGISSEAMPDGSDLHHLRPSTTSVNGNRSNLNFGGEFGAQSFGVVNDGGNSVWYPGDADAGMIARHSFYMAVRYDGSNSGTTNLEVVNGDPSTSGSLMGDLSRMIEWHFAAPPDAFERGRNQIIYDDYQNNRNSFIDRPEYMWSIFVDQANDSRITIAGTTSDANGSSTQEVDLGRIFVGSAVPAAQSFTLDKSGSDGTYYEVTTTGAATSSIAGQHNAFRTNQTDTSSINVGIDSTTATAGLKTGTVTIDNLDITSGGGTGRGANDGDDTFNISLAVLDHPVASFSFNIESRENTIDFGVVPLGSNPVSWTNRFTNLAAGGFPDFVANLDLDGIVASGDTDAFLVDLAPFTGLEQGDFVSWDNTFFPDAVGEYSATYTLQLSDEDLPGELNQSLTLTLIGEVVDAGLLGDYNDNGTVDAADYVLWRKTYNQMVPEFSGADGNGDGTIGDGDYVVWAQNFGATNSGAAAGHSATVPEPTGLMLSALGLIAVAHYLRRARRR